ncbi:MAG: AcrR family transcriptional regulator [Salibacteraceae bacterium]|jgi:AcrR family transcriptional regulator
MTDKQINILITAMELFASLGFDGASTKAIAKEAGVSEGLIFKHFKNKEGLLEAIINYGMEKASVYFSEVILISDPKKRIKKAISLPFTIDPNDNQFWKLMYALKWQRGEYESAPFALFRASLVDAFEQLGYENPEIEATLIEVIIDGVATQILLKKIDAAPLLETTLNKYSLN